MLRAWMWYLCWVFSFVLQLSFLAASLHSELIMQKHSEQWRPLQDPGQWHRLWFHITRLILCQELWIPRKMTAAIAQWSWQSLPKIYHTPGVELVSWQQSRKRIDHRQEQKGWALLSKDPESGNFVRVLNPKLTYSWFFLGQRPEMPWKILIPGLISCCRSYPK